MKKQYFGDKRDLFKFDLIVHIITHIIKTTEGRGFTYIPMLTPNDKTGHGEDRNLRSPKNVGHKNTGLIEFFDPIHDMHPDKRDIGTIRKYFKSVAIPARVYAKNEYFDEKNRDSYFKGVKKSLIQNTFIFVDPDTGLQPEKSYTEKHLLYKEAEGLYNAMGEHSILAIIQFKRRGDGRDKIRYAIDEKRVKLFECTKDMCIFVSDYNVTFFCLTKNFETKHRLSNAIICYKKEYENLYCGGIIL